MPANRHSAPPTRRIRQAFTLVEVMVGMAILGIAMTLAIGGWAQILTGQKRIEAQTTLDMNVRASIERLRADVRMSDLNNMLFWPAGVGPYTGISFPAIAPTAATNLLSGSSTNIVWDRTIIYHVFVSSPNQLKRTIFYHRNLTAAITNRQAQLNRVVADGHGTNACLSGETTTTTTLFANLFEWDLSPRTKQFDCYAATTMRDRVLFGSTVLNSGAHTVEFKVIGKNQAGNTNLYLGIDALNCSVSGSDQEGEFVPSTRQGGITVVTTNYIPNGSWSGNYQLRPHATAVGQGVSLTIQNDCWTEGNFETPGAIAENVQREFSTDTIPYKHYVIRLNGTTGTVWTAGGDNNTSQDPSSQCNDWLYDSSQPAPVDVCARVLIKGDYIRTPQAYGPILQFNKSTTNPNLENPTIALADTTQCDAIPGSIQPLIFFNGAGTGNWEDFGFGTVYAMPAAPFLIYSNVNYLVSYYLRDVGGSAYMTHNEDYRAPNIGSYLLTNTTSAATTSAIWSSRSDLITDREYYRAKYASPWDPGKIYGLYKIASAYVSNGVYTSGIFDSCQEVNTAKTVSWSNNVPSGSWMQLFARTGNAPDLSDATDWDSCTALTTQNGNFANNSGRYIQFRAKMGTTGSYISFPPTPKLVWVSFKWPGATKMIDVSGYLSRGVDYAQCEVTVDGQPLVRSLKVDLTIYKDVRRISGGTERFTSFISAEVSPRNTGL
jgi:prepilin-type N-terminal cleavage/methylation domain-containing protein